MKMVKFTLVMTLAFIIILSIPMYFLINHNETKPVQASGSQSDKDVIDGVAREVEVGDVPKPREKAPVQEAVPKRSTVSAVGDVLIHDVVYQAAHTSNGYNFKPMMRRMQPYLQASDLTFANQETMIGGEGLGLSSYPRFNSPFEVGDALKAAGVDIVSIANNHTLDAGEKGIMRATAHWDELGMAYVGAYRDHKDQGELRMMHTKEGISVAFLAYTYGTNGLQVPRGKSYLVNLIDKERIASEMKRARKAGADAIVLSLHFGDEYMREPNALQKDLVQFAAKAGADVVLGHHPHVLQPVEWVEGNPGHRTLVVYSLGNFLSGQKGIYKQTGGMLSWDFVKKGGRTVVEHPRFMPTYVTYGKWTPEPMYHIKDSEVPGIQAGYAEIKKHMSQYMPDLAFVEK